MSDQDSISPYNIKQAKDENKEKYQLRDYKLIQYQILQTNITRTVWQTVRWITNDILGVKRLSVRFLVFTSMIKKIGTLVCYFFNHLVIIKCTHLLHQM